ncbi:MAG TPA: glycosyltransferase family 2 protein [Bacteroidales bacterium]|nr:glycosyltransferase family 2 protein [Bacteroidales bacterium]
MEISGIMFWVSLAIVFYTYIGYGIILYMMTRLKKLISKKHRKGILNKDDLPRITLMIPAYNERDYVKRKMENSYSLLYPEELLEIVWVTDGSDDGTPLLLENYKDVKVLHKPERNGKIAAINRAIKHVSTPLVVFSDANTVLGRVSLLRIANLFSDSTVGCVSGEKRIYENDSDAAAGAGEGIYWKYESALKKMDASLHSVVGAAGELFAIRTKLFNEVEGDTILDDFIISLRVAMQGYKIAYDPDAYAIEAPSSDVKEELKRKVRIAAGGIQSVIRLYPLLNIFKYGLLSFQYISHRVLRWTVAPMLLPFIFLLNILLAASAPIYTYFLLGQVLFYLAAIAGYLLEARNIKIKGLFIPYYFVIMNWAVYLGMARYALRAQSVNWERAKRAS